MLLIDHHLFPGRAGTVIALNEVDMFRQIVHELLPVTIWRLGFNSRLLLLLDSQALERSYCAKVRV